MAKFLDETNHTVGTDASNKFELDSRILKTRQDLDALAKKGKVPPSQFALRNGHVLN